MATQPQPQDKVIIYKKEIFNTIANVFKLNQDKTDTDPDTDTNTYEYSQIFNKNIKCIEFSSDNDTTCGSPETEGLFFSNNVINNDNLDTSNAYVYFPYYAENKKKLPEDTFFSDENINGILSETKDIITNNFTIQNEQNNTVTENKKMLLILIYVLNNILQLFSDLITLYYFLQKLNYSEFDYVYIGLGTGSNPYQVFPNLILNETDKKFLIIIFDDCNDTGFGCPINYFDDKQNNKNKKNSTHMTHGIQNTESTQFDDIFLERKTSFMTSKHKIVFFQRNINNFKYDIFYSLVKILDSNKNINVIINDTIGTGDSMDIYAFNVEKPFKHFSLSKELHEFIKNKRLFYLITPGSKFFLYNPFTETIQGVFIQKNKNTKNKNTKNIIFGNSLDKISLQELISLNFDKLKKYIVSYDNSKKKILKDNYILNLTTYRNSKSNSKSNSNSNSGVSSENSNIHNGGYYKKKHNKKTKRLINKQRKTKK
jgi:hypothetical protein